MQPQHRGHAQSRRRKIVSARVERNISPFGSLRNLTADKRHDHITARTNRVRQANSRPDFARCQIIKGKGTRTTLPLVMKGFAVVYSVNVFGGVLQKIEGGACCSSFGPRVLIDFAK